MGVNKISMINPNDRQLPPDISLIVHSDSYESLMHAILCVYVPNNRKYTLETCPRILVTSIASDIHESMQAGLSVGTIRGIKFV